MVHLDGLDLTHLVGGHETDLHPFLHHTGLNTADRHRPDTGDRVDVLDREAEGEIDRFLGLGERVERLKQRRALVPGSVLTEFGDVVTDKRTYRDEAGILGLVADYLDQLCELVLNLVVALLVVIDDVHLVDSDNQLVDPECAGEEDVLPGLFHHAVRRGDDQQRGICLGCARDHVLDEVTVARAVHNGEVVLVSIEPLVSDIDRDTALALFLEAVHYPGELERALSLGLCLLPVRLNDMGRYGSRLKE